MFRTVDIIIKKRDGNELTKSEIAFLLEGYVQGIIPDYQMSSFLMAIYWRGLSDREMVDLTDIMVHSGEVIDLSAIKGIKVDKHSTGGVGDKTSLVIAPLASVFGIKMAKMSGRGLGHTGGTLDKLEAIPGFRINLSQAEFFNQLNDIGLAIIGQTANIVPADKLLYALRDVTGTIDSVGLIASSIMSKKLASGADHIVLDVKVGSGAFMKDLKSAQALAKAMVAIGRMSGKNTIANITSMEEPLGCAVGNSLEVIEAIETLKGSGPADFTKICYQLTAEIMMIAGIVDQMDDAFEMIKEAILEGKALDKFKKMLIAQGGNPLIIDDYRLLKLAENEILVFADEVNGTYVAQIDALKIGEAAMILGAGRESLTDKIDYGVGIVLHKKCGDIINSIEPIATIYSNGRRTDEAIIMVKEAYQYSKQYVKKPVLILDRIA